MSPEQLDQLEVRTGHHLLAGPGLRLGDGTQVSGGNWGYSKSQSSGSPRASESMNERIH